MNNFNHLEQLDGGKKKVQKAKDAVKSLKSLVEDHDKKIKDEEEITKRRREALEKLNANKAVLKKLEDINTIYTKLVYSIKPQERGYELEK